MATSAVICLLVIAAAAEYPWYVAGVLVLFGGGLLTALVAARRAPAQNELDTVQTVKLAMGELREELIRVTRKADDLEAKLDVLEAEREALREDRDRWRQLAYSLGHQG